VVLPGSSEAAQICTVQSGKAIARRVEKRGNGCKGYSGQTLHPFEMAPSIYAARCGAAIVIHPIRMFSLFMFGETPYLRMGELWSRILLTKIIRGTFGELHHWTLRLSITLGMENTV
jgi:hypothetical protein